MTDAHWLLLLPLLFLVGLSWAWRRRRSRSAAVDVSASGPRSLKPRTPRQRLLGMRQNSDDRLVRTVSLWYRSGLGCCVKEVSVPCPHCAATATAEQPRRTALGYRTFRCRTCRRGFNERTGTPFNHLQYPTDVVLLVVLWRLRYNLSLRDLAEMFLPRGVAFTHEAVREWERALRPAAHRAAAGQAPRAGRCLVVRGRDVPQGRSSKAASWCSLYRAIDRDGDLVDARLSETRDLDAARRFFRQRGRDHRPDAGARDDRRPRRRPPRDPRDARRARSPTAPAAISITASSRTTGRSSSGTTRCAASRECRVGEPLLSRPRGAAPVLPRAPPAHERVSLAAQRRLFHDRWAAVLTALAAGSRSSRPARLAAP